MFKGVGGPFFFERIQSFTLEAEKGPMLERMGNALRIRSVSNCRRDRDRLYQIIGRTRSISVNPPNKIWAIGGGGAGGTVFVDDYTSSGGRGWRRGVQGVYVIIGPCWFMVKLSFQV